MAGETTVRPQVRMLHTSDIHIAGDAPSLEGLRAVVGKANELDVDIVLVAGDLFDNARVGEEAVGLTLAELERIRRPVVIIPGNHDCVDERSIYHRVDLTAAGSHVYFAGNPAGEELVFEDLSLVVWARGIESHDPRNRPLAGYSPADPRYWRVVMTHGHYVPDGDTSGRSSPINQQEIGQLECDYVALGHWHRFCDVSEGDVNAFYSGSPSDFGLSEATVNVVTLSVDGKVTVERESIGF